MNQEPTIQEMAAMLEAMDNVKIGTCTSCHRKNIIIDDKTKLCIANCHEKKEMII